MDKTGFPAPGSPIPPHPKPNPWDGFVAICKGWAQLGLKKSFLSKWGSGLLVGMSLWGSLMMPAHATEYAYAPVSGSMTSPFGWRTDPFTGSSRFHGGIDIAAPEGSAVYSPQAGVVIYSGVYGGYGNVVVVQHPGDLYTLYGHNSYLLVKPGDRIQPGQMVSMVGSTGRSTGPHLHFEVRQGNGYVNPLDYLGYLQRLAGSRAGQTTLGRMTPIEAPTGNQPQKEALALQATGQVIETSGSVSHRSSGKSSAPKRVNRRSSKKGWNIELIKGSDVEMIEF
ncbi:MAG: M23 family metallopeptidase [Cyanobacteria bacterium]|nr:M23 family metallopeptidase [Cyanobacteriota bacterium]